MKYAKRTTTTTTKYIDTMLKNQDTGTMQWFWSKVFDSDNKTDAVTNEIYFPVCNRLVLEFKTSTL